MNSIKTKLSRYLSFSISILLISILLATDISVDTWVSNEFDRAMINKSNLLITLIDEDNEKVEFDFSDEFMPEFSGIRDPEYFQLWYKNTTFERSETLSLFSVNELPKIETPLNTSIITDIILPDGRSGKMITSSFIPQIDSDARQHLGVSLETYIKTQKPMTLAYAMSNEDLHQIEWFIDIIFILSSISAVIVVKLIVGNVVDRELRPLDKLNNEIVSIDLNSDINSIKTDDLPTELLPIANGINHFLKENMLLYAREKRLTSDIAHELKTPVTELINLSEVVIKFPNERQLLASFPSDVLNISERSKSIVNGILLLQKSTSDVELIKDSINVETLIKAIIIRENNQNRSVELDIKSKSTNILTNEFALETILTNLLNNAFYYSPPDSTITVVIDEQPHNNQIKISIINTSIYQYTTSELDKIFEPLWQKDLSRTSSQRYGLGLAIVKSYCENINVNISVSLVPQNRICFELSV